MDYIKFNFWKIIFIDLYDKNSIQINIVSNH